MSNALFKLARERVVVPPPPPPPPPPVRRLVRRVGTRPRYKEYVLINVIDVAGDKTFQSVQQIKERDGSEQYEYYEWVIEESPIPPQKPPVVTPIPAAWDATARSGDAITLPMVAEWVVGPGNVDMVVGISTLSGPPTLPPGPETGDAAADAATAAARAAAVRASVVNGFRISGSTAYVHSAPPPEFGNVGVEQRYDSQPVAPGTVCRLECARGVVRYLVDGELMATGPAFVYEGQAVHLRAALYGTTDTLEDPSLESVASAGSADVVMAPITARGGRYSEGRAMLGLYAVSQRRLGVQGIMGPLWARAGRVGGSGNPRLAPIAAWGSGMQGNSGSGAVTMAPITAKGGDYADGVATLAMFAFGRGGADVPPQLTSITPLADLWDASFDPRPHGGAYAVAGLRNTFAAEHRSNRALPARLGMLIRAKASRVWPGLLQAVLGMHDTEQASRVFDVALVGSMGTRGTVLGVLVVSGRLDVRLGLDDDLTGQRLADTMVRAGLGIEPGTDVQAQYNAALRAALGVALAGTRDADDFLVWSVERGGASAAYSGFGFGSFANIGGRIFAAGDTGLYELGGPDDDGVPIAAWVDLGQRDFGTSLLKGISNAYLTTASGNRLVVRVTTPEGNRYTYTARRADPAMQAQRVDFGRGLRATYLQLELTNDGNGDFDLERLEFVVTPSTRRI